MLPTEITYFTVTLFLALCVLINWKRRRDVVAARLNRGLRGYVDARDPVELAAADKSQTENLIPA